MTEEGGFDWRFQVEIFAFVGGEGASGVGGGMEMVGGASWALCVLIRTQTDITSNYQGLEVEEVALSPKFTAETKSACTTARDAYMG